MGKHIPRVKGKRQTRRADPRKIAKSTASITKGTSKSSSKPSSRVLGEADAAAGGGKFRPGKQERAYLKTKVEGSSITSISNANSSLKEERVAKTRRGQRILKARAPHLVENDKKVLIIKGSKTSQVINDALKDISSLTKPLCKTYSRNNDLLPFEVNLIVTYKFS